MARCCIATAPGTSGFFDMSSFFGTHFSHLLSLVGKSLFWFGSATSAVAPPTTARRFFKLTPRIWWRTEPSSSTYTNCLDLIIVYQLRSGLPSTLLNATAHNHRDLI